MLRPWLSFVIALLSGLQITVFPLPALGQPLPEHRAKAEYLSHLPRYFEWATASEAESSTTNAPFVIGIAGAPEVESELVELSKSMAVRHRPLVVLHVGSPSETRSCSLLYIGFSDRRTVASYLTPIRRNQILTVGDRNDFLALGGDVRLLRRENQLKIQIHVANVAQSGFTISPQLLSIAELIR